MLNEPGRPEEREQRASSSTSAIFSQVPPRYNVIKKQDGGVKAIVGGRVKEGEKRTSLIRLDRRAPQRKTSDKKKNS